MTTRTTAAQRVTYVDMALAWMLLDQADDLPLPTSVTVENDHVEMTVDTAADVEAWAERMGVDATHHLHGDGTWTDRAEGTITVRPTHLLRSIRQAEVVQVAVYRPADGPYTPLGLVA